MISEAYSNQDGYIRNDNYIMTNRIEENNKQIPMILDSLDKEIKGLTISLEKLFSKLQCCTSVLACPKPAAIEEHNLCAVANRIKDANNEINKFRFMIDSQCDALQL